tara:strand:- start:630 stop:752 length:123 start_codon:yes stop_codon:yes gene_type:complete
MKVKELIKELMDGHLEDEIKIKLTGDGINEFPGYIGEEKK